MSVCPYVLTLSCNFTEMLVIWAWNKVGEVSLIVIHIDQHCA